MDWIELALAMGLFMASHRLPALFGLKARLVGALGSSGYVLAFSALSLGLLGWLIVAAGRAPFVPLWDQVGWHRWAVNLAMPLACLLAAFGTAASNPFAFEGHTTGFSPDRPGIAGLTRQPLLWALALWAGAHLLANGDLAHGVLFAPFLALALLGMPLVETRRRRAMGQAEWARLSARTGLMPFGALVTRRWRPAGPPSLPRLALGLGAWVGLWHLHPALIGVWPGP
jgi:uncharacterized membrane protein